MQQEKYTYEGPSQMAMFHSFLYWICSCFVYLSLYKYSRTSIIRTSIIRTSDYLNIASVNIVYIFLSMRNKLVYCLYCRYIVSWFLYCTLIYQNVSVPFSLQGRREIVTRLGSGETLSEIAVVCGISKLTICDIKRSKCEILKKTTFLQMILLWNY